MIRKGKLSWLLGVYVKLKLRFRAHKNRYWEVAEKILKEIFEEYVPKLAFTTVPAHFLTKYRVTDYKITDALALPSEYFASRYEYKPDPFFGLFDRLYDLDVFVERGGGDCDDFSMAVGRVLHLLSMKEVYHSFKVFFVTVIGPIREISKWHTFIVVDDGEYHIISPYRLIGRAKSMDEAVNKIAELFKTRYTNYCAISFDEIP